MHFGGLLCRARANDHVRDKAAAMTCGLSCRGLEAKGFVRRGFYGGHVRDRVSQRRFAADLFP
ncbi:hypothetical protein D3C72_2244150 [compost metagenome]